MYFKLRIMYLREEALFQTQSSERIVDNVLAKIFSEIETQNFCKVTYHPRVFPAVVRVHLLPNVIVADNSLLEKFVEICSYSVLLNFQIRRNNRKVCNYTTQITNAYSTLGYLWRTPRGSLLVSTLFSINNYYRSD